MNSASLPTASSPLPTDDTEVESRKGLNQEEVVLEAPQGDLPDSRPKGDEAPEGSKSSPVPDSVLEPTVVPKSGRRPLRKKGKTATPVASVQPEVPDNLLEALNGASMKEEHRTVMSAVIQKVQSAKSGLMEACTSLLTGFEVCVQKHIYKNITAWTVAPDALFGVHKEKPDRGSNNITGV